MCVIRGVKKFRSPVGYNFSCAAEYSRKSKVFLTLARYKNESLDSMGNHSQTCSLRVFVEGQGRPFNSIAFCSDRAPIACVTDKYFLLTPILLSKSAANPGHSVELR